MTNTLHLFKLHPLSSFHIGIEGIGQERIEEAPRSDTLYGALIQSWQLLYDDDWERLVLDEPFKVSSCFPVINKTLFFPLPIGSIDRFIKEKVKGSELKKWKKVRYASEGIFQKIIHGSITFEEIKPSGIFLVEDGKNGIEDFQFEELQVPRVSIDPLTGTVSEGGFFYCVNRYFRNEDGLFFLAKFTENGTLKKFESALRLLGDTGLGGDRSIGRGRFTFTRCEYSLKPPEKIDGYVSLSLYHPTEYEIKANILQNSFYSVTKRFGYVAGFGARSLRRQSVLMLEEGSVFFVTKPPYGDSPLVLKKGEGESPFNVFRYGKAFTIPLTGGCFEY